MTTNKFKGAEKWQPTQRVACHVQCKQLYELKPHVHPKDNFN
jgi:hypothetical protein